MGTVIIFDRATCAPVVWLYTQFSQNTYMYVGGRIHDIQCNVV